MLRSIGPILNEILYKLCRQFLRSCKPMIYDIISIKTEFLIRNSSFNYEINLSNISQFQFISDKYSKDMISLLLFLSIFLI